MGSRLILSNDLPRATLWAIHVSCVKIVVLGWNLGSVLGVLVRRGVTRQVSLYLAFGVVESVW